MGLNALVILAQQQLTQDKLLQSRFADRVYSGEMVAKLTKILATTLETGAEKGQAAPEHMQQSICYNWYLVYYTDGVETSREFLYQDCTTIGGNVDGGGGSDGSGILTPTRVVVAPDKPVNNIQQFLKCFVTSRNATLMVYARQPVPSSNDTWSLSGGVGHTFISISQNGITRVFGFYPTSGVSIIHNATGMFGDNSQTPYTASVTTTITGSNLNNLLQYTYANSSSAYDLNNYNCTDFGIGAAAAAGLHLYASLFDKPVVGRG